MSFFAELKRRNVVRVGLAYIVISWLLAQVAEFAFENFGAPEWVLKTFVVLLLLGLPLVLVFAWAFELTPEGVKLEKNVDRSQSITTQTGHKLNRLTLIVMALAIAYFAIDKFVLSTGQQAQPEAAGAVASAEMQKSIAVLPFVDMSPNKDQEYFTDGLTENLLNALAQVSELRVAGRTSSFAFKNRNEDLRGIGEQLGVAHILEGSVQKSGSKVRITAQLINAESGYHLWSETYDHMLEDIFAVQDEIAAEVAKAMRVTLLGHGPEGHETASQDATTAYNEYLKGHYEAGRGGMARHEQALVHFERALQLDPTLALAWAGRSYSLAIITGFSDTDFSAGYKEARNSALRALELDPELPEAYLPLAEIQQAYDWDWEAAEATLRRALALRPGDADIRLMLAELKNSLGARDEAFADIQQVVAQDPLNWRAQFSLAMVLAHRGNFDEALQMFDRLVENDAGRSALFWGRGYLRLLQGEYQLALEEFSRESLEFLQLTGQAIAYHHLQNREEAVASLQELIRKMGESSSFQIAAVYAQWGDADNAMSWLERAYVIRDPGLQLLIAGVLFDPIKDDPRFQAFVRKMKFAPTKS
jgi:TolB-like protein/predicted negative regulator of RcsB-dependent stress response